MSNVNSEFKSLLEKPVSVHGHVCGGQLLGVRMAMAGLRELDVTDPDKRHNLVVYVEVDRCIADAIQIVSGCTMGRRSLKVIDYGKFRATFVNVTDGKAVRVSSKKDARPVQ